MYIFIYFKNCFFCSYHEADVVCLDW